MESKPKDRSLTNAWRSAAALGLVALIGTALLAGVNRLTQDRIAEQERRAVLEQLEQLIPAERYDNVFHDDLIFLSGDKSFSDGQDITVYRARRQGQAVAAVFRMTAPDGYNGAIRLMVGINADGSLAGVRVTSHKETPGLGDALETAKSDWILGFTGRSLTDPEPQNWAVKRDGGVFDQFSGATITPRAVVKAVRMALEYFAENRDMLFSRPPDRNE